MDRRLLSFLAIAISIAYGLGFALFDEAPTGYAVVGAGLVAISWLAVGMLGRDRHDPRDPR